jgi:3-carboxy-cis,cis-muconate cycloisomerase
MSLRLLESLVTTEPLAEVFSDDAVIAAMLRFETALAQAESRIGVIPASAAAAIAAAAVPGSFDAAAMARAARTTGTIAIPLVDALITRVRAAEPAASAFVHCGATSQDVTDTALVLCLVRARAIVKADHQRLVASLRRLSDQHAATVMLGRTLLQPAPPITFGLKSAGWFAAISRAGARMLSDFDTAAVLQFGGASGTLAALGSHGLIVAAELARELELSDPGAPWHGQRDRLAALVASCGIYTGILAKIARDVALLMQHEVGEAAEPGGRSSTMPHKRNPAGCAVALAAATRLPALVAAFLAGMPQEHERGVGGWHAEAATVAEAVQATGAALAAVAGIAEALSVDPDRMKANIAATGGVVFAERAVMMLAPKLGREAAQRIVAKAIDAARSGGRQFAEALAADRQAAEAIGPTELSTLDSPEAYLGVAEELRRRLLE